ncbi:hypothetical protein IWQ60_005944 [Tieghemiomyces parasiticus]|uniref:Delta(24)-sterol reductase n=1 Tax=Tieghemiomyces parasiticus TaxID=78921 RepID=A0A9W8A5B0_9FUNG|nr:hypothetical protein IWQ60_005944 [Tieghemiomyces parasiticus]
MASEATPLLPRHQTTGNQKIHNVLVQMLTLVWFLCLPLRSVVNLVLGTFNFFVWRPFVWVFVRTPFAGLLARFVERNTWVVILFFALPASYIFDMFFSIRNWYVRSFLAAPKLHDQRVREVQAQVKRWNEQGRKSPMCTARPGWLTMSTRSATFKEDCSRISVNLHDIIEVDTERQVVKVEPLVDMGQITAHLVPMGWSLAIMVEMEDLTVGGLLMGVGLEVNSHIYGLMFETVERFEVVLGDGSLVTCSRTENSDLFHALPMSHGTLGFLVSAELKIIPCKPYMHLTYEPCHTLDEMADKVTKYCESDNPPPFLEVTVYSKETSVIMLGEFADVTTAEQRAKINHVNRWYAPWFYKHVEKFLTTGQADEYIPLRQYFHRHTRSIFWKLEELIPFGNHPLYRYLLGWLGAPKIAFLKLFTHTPEVRRKVAESAVYQDIIVPISTIRESVILFDEVFDFYPLLFYPVKLFYKSPGTEGLIRNPRHVKEGTNPPWEMYFDLGVYGIPGNVRRGEPWDAAYANRAMEKFARDNAGFQLMYADTWQTRPEFEEMFDHTLYRKCREKYNAVGAFPEFWDKVKPQDQR